MKKSTSNRIVIGFAILFAGGLLTGILSPETAANAGRTVFYGAWGRLNSLLGIHRMGIPAAAEKCRHNLMLIEAAKRRAAEDAGGVDNVSMDQIVKANGGKLPACPSGGQYTVGSLMQLPTCSVRDNRTSDPRDDHILHKF